MKRNFLTYILLCILLLGSAACQDDPLYNGRRRRKPHQRNREVQAPYSCIEWKYAYGRKCDKEYRGLVRVAV